MNITGVFFLLSKNLWGFRIFKYQIEVRNRNKELLFYLVLTY